ncbi:MAG: hypothetical protein LUG61_05030 [Lachnospiraceae bacterium]|nr:hypothetical protein [Lachnospiraceae bacterium]
MTTRVGRVTATYPATGKVKVTYEDTGNTSLPVSLLTMNSEYSMPAVGDRVVTLHMENGSSKGFCLGTYYGGGTTPRATSGYRKDLNGGAYIVCSEGVYDLNAASIQFETSGAELLLDEENLKVEAGGSISLKGTDLTLESEGDLTLSGAAGSVTLKELLDTLKDYEGRIAALEGGA